MTIDRLPNTTPQVNDVTYIHPSKFDSVRSLAYKIVNPKFDTVNGLHARLEDQTGATSKLCLYVAHWTIHKYHRHDVARQRAAGRRSGMIRRKATELRDSWITKLSNQGWSQVEIAYFCGGAMGQGITRQRVSQIVRRDCNASEPYCKPGDLLTQKRYCKVIDRSLVLNAQEPRICKPTITQSNGTGWQHEDASGRNRSVSQSERRMDETDIGIMGSSMAATERMEKSAGDRQPDSLPPIFKEKKYLCH